MFKGPEVLVSFIDGNPPKTSVNQLSTWEQLT